MQLTENVMQRKCIKVSVVDFSVRLLDKIAENVYGIDIAYERAAYFLPFPYAVRFVKEEEKTTMKILKQLLLAIAFVFCISMSASAQTNDGKKTPPKDGKPPVVVVKEKPKPKEEKPKDDNRVKKPQAVLFKAENEIEISFV